MKTPQEKYMYDPQYHSIVDKMIDGIRTNYYTPSELREMAVFAATKYEMEAVRRIILHKDKVKDE